MFTNFFSSLCKCLQSAPSSPALQVRRNSLVRSASSDKTLTRPRSVSAVHTRQQSEHFNMGGMGQAFAVSMGLSVKADAGITGASGGWDSEIFKNKARKAI
jgi:hypothetical protein